MPHRHFMELNISETIKVSFNVLVALFDSRSLIT